ncbi:MAG: hypothetical protein CMF99_05455 [Candidatus Marinimicrobia bacterium]|nr:hypothetical protein [Candidatus Neomarinimicrobiota bacterium]
MILEKIRIAYFLCFSCNDNNKLELIYFSIIDASIYIGNFVVLLKFSRYKNIKKIRSNHFLLLM